MKAAIKAFMKTIDWTCLTIGLMGLLVVAAIVVPNCINAVNRGKQKQSMADARSIGTAIESYRVDNGFVPGVQSMEELARHIKPTYAKRLPLVDGWGTGFRVEAWSLARRKGDSEGAAGVRVVEPANDFYVVRSAGKDGAWEAEDPRRYVRGATTSFSRDILFGVMEYVKKE